MLNVERIRHSLIPALRDPNRTQTTGALRRRGATSYPDGDCCLGVACDVSGLGHWVSGTTYMDGAYAYIITEDGEVIESQTGDLPRAVMKYFGFDEIGGGWFRIGGIDAELWSHNDSGVSFAKIADALEARCQEIEEEQRESGGA